MKNVSVCVRVCVCAVENSVYQLIQYGMVLPMFVYTVVIWDMWTTCSVYFRAKHTHGPGFFCSSALLGVSFEHLERKKTAIVDKIMKKI